MNLHLQKESLNAPEIALRIFIAVLIVVIGIGAFIFFNKTKPKVKKVRPERQPPRVEIINAEISSREVIVSALGTVTAEKDIELKSRLSGEVVMVSPEFIPGGLFRKGEVILKIDPADYTLEVKRMESLLSSAQATYDIEMGYQDVAREELTLMEMATGKKVEENDLALRKPQLDQAKAQLETARVNLEVARLNLARTTIRAPFNGMIQSVSVDLGTQVGQQSKLADFTGTDTYRIEASIPVHTLDWIKLPDADNETGSRVEVTTRYERGNYSYKHSGDVVRLTGSLSEQSRMATVLVNVSDPLGLSGKDKIQPLILGSYVSLEITGKKAENIYRIPRKALRENDSVWLFQDGRLHIQPIGIAWKDENSIFVNTGIKTGDAVIVSNLSSPVEKMKLMRQGGNAKQEKKKRRAGTDNE